MEGDITLAQRTATTTAAGFTQHWVASIAPGGLLKISRRDQYLANGVLLPDAMLVMVPHDFDQFVATCGVDKVTSDAEVTGSIE